MKVTEYKLLPNQFAFLFDVDKEKLNKKDVHIDVAAYIGGVTCVPKDAEYLTPTGWKTIDTLTLDSKLAVYYDDGSIRFENPLYVHKYPADKWYNITNKFISQRVCPNHKIVTWTRTGKKRERSAEEFVNIHNNTKHGINEYFKLSFNKDEGISSGLTEAQLRLAVAYQADGYNCNNKAAFHLKKKRKIDRLKLLLEQSRIKYNERKETDGYTRIMVKDSIPMYKEYPIEWYDLTSKEYKIIIDEVAYWDGCKDNTGISYYCSKKSNVDFIQYAAHCCGHKANIYSRTREQYIYKNKEATKFTEYRCKITRGNPVSLRNPYKLNKISETIANKGEFKYCPRTNSGMWVMRYNNKIVITGNSGKTFCGSLRGLYFALKWAGCKGLVGALSQDLLDTTTKVKYLEHLNNIGLKEGVHWWFIEKGSAIKFLNGSYIKFKTLSDWRQFMSTEYTWIEFEEASFIDEITFKKLLTRLREFQRPEWEGYYRAMFLHTNPQGRRGWIYKYFRNKDTKIPSYRCVTASTRENYHLGSSYIDLLEDIYSAEEIAEMIEGQDLDNDNTIAFPSFTEGNIKELEYDSNYPLILTCDFNYNPMCWYLVQRREDSWYIIKELIAQNVTTKQMCEMVQKVIEEYRTQDLIIMGDSHGRDKKTNGSDYSVMLQHFSKAGIRCLLKVQKSNPRIKERLSILRGFICNAKGVRRLFVDKSCTHLIYNFEEAKNNLGNGGLKEPTDKEIQADGKKLFLIHPIDAISYPIHYEQTLQDISNNG